MRPAVLLSMLALAGCASTAHLMSKPPAFVVESTRSEPALEECLALKLSWLGTPAVIHGESRTILTWGAPTPAFAIALVPQPPGTSIEVRAAAAAGRKMRDDIRSCAAT